MVPVLRGLVKCNGNRLYEAIFSKSQDIDQFWGTLLIREVSSRSGALIWPLTPAKELDERIRAAILNPGVNLRDPVQFSASRNCDFQVLKN